MVLVSMLALFAVAAVKAAVSTVEPSIVHVMVTSTVTVQSSQSANAVANINARQVDWQLSEPVWTEPVGTWSEPTPAWTEPPSSLSTSTNSTPEMPQSHAKTAMMVGIVIGGITVAFAIIGVLYTLYVRLRHPFKSRKARIRDIELNARWPGSSHARESEDTTSGKVPVESRWSLGRGYHRGL